MRIGIVGAGGAGLAAGRHCYDQNHDFEIFEQTPNVGGTWNFIDLPDLTTNGLLDEEVHSSMYQGLKTNLPKELMAFEGFPYSKDIEDSYVEQAKVIEYLNNFANEAKILPFITFFTRVIRIEPTGTNGWSIETENVRTKLKATKQYDAVMICNGHYKEPILPTIAGFESFAGNAIHSHYYRYKDNYRNCKVLVIGGGASGADISQQIATVADKVYLCCKLEPMINVPATIIQKPILKQLHPNAAEFVDGSTVEIDKIIFCTGYKYAFPFLTNNCRINVDNNYVNPLYKHVINIEHPTMAFIGIPFQVCPFPMFDIQVRFFLSTLNDDKNNPILPSNDEMWNDLKQEWLRKSGVEKKHFHRLGDDQGSYFNELSQLGGIKPIPSVINQLFYYVRRNRNLNDKFRIIDDEHYLQI